MDTPVNYVVYKKNDAPAIKIGWGKHVKVWWSDKPNGSVIVAIDIPGAWSHYLCFEVKFLVWHKEFCLLAVK